MLTRDEARRITGKAKLPKQPHGVTLAAVPDSNCRATGVLVAGCYGPTKVQGRAIGHNAIIGLAPVGGAAGALSLCRLFWYPSSSLICLMPPDRRPRVKKIFWRRWAFRARRPRCPRPPA